MKILLLRTILLGLFIGPVAAVMAQETTSTLSGIITDSKGAIVAGASIIVKHIPTGFSTGTQTNNKGIFVIPNLNVEWHTYQVNFHADIYQNGKIRLFMLLISKYSVRLYPVST